MTFHQYPSGSSFDPVLNSSFDDGFNDFCSPQDHRRNFYSCPPNFGGASSQNIDLNYYHFSPRSVPHSSFSGDFHHQLPYANHGLLPKSTRSNAWANIGNSEPYISPSPEYCSQLLNNFAPDCYNMQRSLTLPDPMYSSYLHPGGEYRTGFNAGFNYGQNQNSFDIGLDNCRSLIPSPSQLGHCQQQSAYQHAAYPFQHKETANDGRDDCFPVLHNYAIDEIVQNAVESSAMLMGENRNTSNIQSSLLDNKNYIQQPDFSYCSPTKQQLYAAGRNFEASHGADMFSKSIVLDYNAANESEAIGQQSLAEISSFARTGRMLADCELNDSGGKQQADCKFSTSCMMNLSVNGSPHVNHINSVSSPAHQFICESVPELPKSRAEPVIFVPTTNTSDRHNTQIESRCCSRVVTSQSGMDVLRFTGGCDIPMDAGERNVVSKGEVSISCAESGDASTGDNCMTSDAMQFEHWQSNASEETQPDSGINSSPVILPTMSVASKCATGSQELMPEVTETTESHRAMHDCDDAVSNASDDVIIVSPSPTDHETTAPVSTHPNPVTCAVKSYGMQPTCVLGRETTDGLQLRSILRPIVPNSLLRGNGDAVGVPHRRNLPSVRLTGHDFTKLRNCDVLPTCAKRITVHNYTEQTTNCQRQFSHCAMSRIPTASHQPSAGWRPTTCSYVKPAFCRPHITAVSGPPREQHLYSAELKRLLCQKDEMSKSRACNPTLGGNGHCNMLENNRQKHVLLSTASSHALPRYENAQNNAQKYGVSAATASLSICSTSLPHSVRFPPPVRNQNQCTYYKSGSLPVFRRSSSAMQLHGMRLRRTRTYSIRAASILLQQLKQAKLSHFMSAHSARQLSFNRRLSLLMPNEEVIDLTADDECEEDVVETCEHIFARARRRMATVPLWLHALRQNFFTRSSMANGSCCDSKHRPTEKTFAVDKSLPFYRCFVQMLLRNYRFSSSGLPVKVYPAFCPPARPNVSFASRDVIEPGNSHAYKELVGKKQLVVLLKKLDQSLLNESGTVDVKTLQSGVRALSASRKSEAENCVRVTRTNANSAQKFTEDEWTEKEDNRKEDASLQVSVNERRHHDVVSSCRPVSVVLERLDRIKIHQICKELRKTEPCRQENQQMTQPGMRSNVSDFCWTVVQVPRPNKVPVLLIRASMLVAQNDARNKVTKKTRECPTQQIKSALKRLRTRSCTNDIRCLRSSEPTSLVVNVSQKRTAKKKSGCRKLRFQSSVLMSLRSRNRAGRTLRCRYSAPVKRPPHQISKSSRKQSKSLAKLLAKMEEKSKKGKPILTKRLHAAVISVEQDVHMSASDSTTKNTVVDNLLPCDSVLNQDSPESSVPSDSDTVEMAELSPYTSMDVVSVDQGVCLELSEHSQNAKSTDLLPCDYSDNDTIELSLSPYTSMEVDQDICLEASSLIPENAVSADLLPVESVFSDNVQKGCSSSFVDTIELSSHSMSDVNFSCKHDHHSVASDVIPKNALSLPHDTVSNIDVPEDCHSSDSNTVEFSPVAATDDLTIVYRSPLSDVGFDFDETSLDQQEATEGGLEADNSSRKSDICSGEELKPTSSLNCGRVISQPYTATASGSIPFLSTLVESPTSSESLDGGLVASNAENSVKLQPAESHLDCYRVTSHPDAATASGSLQFLRDLAESYMSSESLGCDSVASNAENSELQIASLQLAGSMNDGLERLCADNNSQRSEFMDNGEKKDKAATLSPLKLS